MSEAHVFLGGEGTNELGSWAGDPAYQHDGSPGVIKALLLRARPNGWRVVGARTWKTCRKYTDHVAVPEDLRRHIRGDHEKRAVLGLVLDAKERGAHVVAFVRDQDGDPERARIVRDAAKQARSYWPHIRVVGDTAIPVIEAWTLALLGETGTESLSKKKAQSLLEERGVGTTEEMVREVLANRPVPKDATGLCSWLVEATEALAREA